VTRAISTTSRRKLSSGCFFLQGKAPKKIHAILKETLWEHSPSLATVKNWVAQFKRGDFSTCDAPCPGRPKTVTAPEIIDQIHELILEYRRILAKSIARIIPMDRVFRYMREMTGKIDKLLTALFWALTQPVVVRNYHYWLRNSQEERS